MTTSNHGGRFPPLDSGKPFELRDVTAVVCTKNAEHIIEECISAAIEARVFRVLVVDGHSQDQTAALAQNLGIEVYLDDGRGLGAARNLGSRLSKTSLTLFLGPDNLISRDTVSAMVSAINGPQVVAVSCLTSQERKDYWSKAADLYRKSVVFPGDAVILPTPTLYISSLLVREPYSESRRFSDDSELFDRWNRVFGGRNVVVDKYVVEIGNETLRNHLRRFTYYGISDYENFLSGRNSGWTRKRQVRSILHPLRRQVFEVLRVSSVLEFLLFSPGLLLFTLARYFSWVRVASRNKQNLES